jgi:tetratricopeptide (TPR) repeat protein
VIQVEEGGLPPGTEIAGRYKVLEQIGAGGMGRVYRALQAPLDIEVCIKTLHKGPGIDPQFAMRFEREAITTSKLRHPNIVSVIDFGTHVDGTMYLVMEYIRGRSLADISGRGQVLPASRGVRILGQVCDALSASHAMGVLHRDLKPSNIMVQDLSDRPDFVKVLDFGSALILEGVGEAQRLTQVGTVIGTPAYMAPEHILGRGFDARVDVYAVGVLLYKLLSGAPPFRGNTQTVMAQHVTVKPERPSKRNPKAQISPLMERVIMHALVKDPAHRYPSALALKEAMENALAGVGEDGFELEAEQRESQISMEVATEERAVIVVSIRGAYRLDDEITTRVTSAGHSFGAMVETEGETVNLIFGLGREGLDVATEAIQCALDIAAQKTKRPVKVGVHNAQASCRGRPGAPGFRFELYGEGRSLASILANYAPNGQVLISGPVSRYIAPTQRLIPIQPSANFNVPVFRLVETDTPIVDPDHLPFVGRVSEQRELVELAVDAAKGRVCLVVGDEGMGKSRLVSEVTSKSSKLGALWLVVRAGGSGGLGPSHPVSVIAALGWGSSQGLGAAERHALEMMMGRAEAIKDTLRGERRQMRYVSTAIVGLSQRLTYGPVVVVLDDLHLADDMTWALTRRLVDAAPVLGFTAVLCVRSADDVPFALPESTRRLDLKPLASKEMLSLVLSGVKQKDREPLATRPASAVRGIPALGEEIARAVNDDRLELLDTLGDLDPMDALDRLIAERIEGLGPAARRILRGAAVLGLEPRQSELQEFGEAYQDLSALMELESTRSLVRTPRGGMRFASARMREVALSTIPERQLQRLHRDAAEIIARSQEVGRRQLELGEHLLRSASFQEAFGVLRQAAADAQYDGHMRRAVRCLTLASEAGKELGAHHMREQAEVSRDLGELLLQLGATKEAEQILREASFAARAIELASLSADLLRLHGRAVLVLGDTRQGRTELESTLSFTEQRGDVAIAVKTCIDLVEAAELGGDQMQMAEYLRRGLELLDSLDPNELVTARIQLFNRLGRLELERGNEARAIATFAQALDLAERDEDRYQEAGLLGNLGGAYARQKEMAKALYFTERALRASEELGDFLGIARQSFNLALLKLSTGQAGPARDLLRNSREAAGRAGWAEGLAMSQAAIEKLTAAQARPPGARPNSDPGR